MGISLDFLRDDKINYAPGYFCIPKKSSHDPFLLVSNVEAHAMNHDTGSIHPEFIQIFGGGDRNKALRYLIDWKVQEEITRRIQGGATMLLDHSGEYSRREILIRTASLRELEQEQLYDSTCEVAKILYDVRTPKIILNSNTGIPKAINGDLETIAKGLEEKYKVLIDFVAGTL